MPRPDFSLVWGADNAPFTAIEASDYTAGWVFRTGAPPRRVNFDYFQNLSDQRTAWLGEQMLLAVGHEWQDDVSYDAYAVVRSPVNGQLYRSLVGSNLNNEPSVSGSQWALGVVESGNLPFGYFSGLTLSNNGGAPNTTVDTAPGAARSSDNTADITLTSTISGILQSSGAWAAGTGQNKLDTGAKAINSTYHEFVIGHPTLDDDVIYSLSATAPALPGGYAGFRRVGRIATDGSGNILAFKDRGNGYFDWVAPLVDALVVSIASGSANVVLTGMGGAPVRARVQAFISADAGAIKLTATDVPNIATGAATGAWTGGHVAQAGGGSGNETGASEFEVSTDTSGQVIARYYSGTGNAGYKIITFGWQEIR